MSVTSARWKRNCKTPPIPPPWPAPNRLQNSFVQYYSPGVSVPQQHQIFNTITTDTSSSSSPIPTAHAAAANQAGSMKVQVPTSDVSFQYYDGTNAPVPAAFPNLFPNTVTVTTRRDTTANGSLGLFFAQIFGISSTNLTATASATIYAGDVSSLQVIPGVDAHILPVALDVNVWTNFAKGNLSSPWLAGNTSSAPNGNPQLQVYPFGTNTPGSLAWLTPGFPGSVPRPSELD